MPDLLTGSITAKTPDSASVGIASGTVLPFRYVRAGCTMINLSANNISLGFEGTAAILNKGITLTPNGGTWFMDDYTYTKGEITAIAAGATSILTIQEYINGPEE